MQHVTIFSLLVLIVTASVPHKRKKCHDDDNREERKAPLVQITEAGKKPRQKNVYDTHADFSIYCCPHLGKM